MLQIGKKVRVIKEHSSHNASVGDVGVIEDILSFGDEKLYVVVFDGKEFPNGNNFQALENHEIEVVE